MNVDSLLEGLIDEHQHLLMPFIRKAYEAGYRDGLATRPDARDRSPLTSAVTVGDPTPAPARPVIEGGKLVAAPPSSPPAPAATTAGLFDDDPDDDADDGGDDDDPADDRDPTIRASMTVGGLLKRIDRSFGLDRFNILVRIEDPATHRHLKRNVRLSRFLKEAV